jgi:hypothetical protein
MLRASLVVLRSDMGFGRPFVSDEDAVARPCRALYRRTEGPQVAAQTEGIMMSTTTRTVR